MEPCESFLTDSYTKQRKVRCDVNRPVDTTAEVSEDLSFLCQEENKWSSIGMKAQYLSGGQVSMTCQEATASFLLIVNHADFLTIHDILQKGKLKKYRVPWIRCNFSKN